MKRILLLFVMIAAVGAILSASAQNTMRIYCAYKNYILTTENAHIEGMQIIYADSTNVDFIIKPAVAPKITGGGFKGFYLTLNNRTDKICEIFLDQCFIICDGNSVPIANANMLRINADQSSGFIIVSPASNSTTELYQKFTNSSDIYELTNVSNLVFYITYRFRDSDEYKSISIDCNIEKFKKHK